MRRQPRKTHWSSAWLLNKSDQFWVQESKVAKHIYAAWRRQMDPIIQAAATAKNRLATIEHHVHRFSAIQGDLLTLLTSTADQAVLSDKEQLKITNTAALLAELEALARAAYVREGGHPAHLNCIRYPKCAAPNGYDCDCQFASV